jgi:hypothetical protein
MAEKVNQGPSGAPGRKIGPAHGQGSDGAGEHDQLVSQTPMQHDPYKARGEDFPVKEVDDATGQGGPHGTAEGANMLASYSVNQCGPRHVEDSGPGKHGSGTPTDWESGGRAAVVARNFPIKQNKGESNEEGGETSVAEYVNLQTGAIEAKGYSETRVKEVPEAKVKIPSR